MTMTRNDTIAALAARREALSSELDQLAADSIAQATPLEERAARLARIADDMLIVFTAERRAHGLA